jgi:hypothetical protein
VLLCSECHDWAHKFPKLFKKWLRRELPHIYKHISRPNENGYDPKNREEIKKILHVQKFAAEENARTMVPRRGHIDVSAAIMASFVFMALIIILAVISSP